MECSVVVTPGSCRHPRLSAFCSPVWGPTPPSPRKSQVCLVLSLPAAVTSDHEGGCDCYIQGSVAVKTGSVEAQTALKKRQLHTTWEEGLALPLGEDELPTATLRLTLRTCDRFSRHSVVGELCLGLDGASVPLGAAQWGELQTTAKVRFSDQRAGAGWERAGAECRGGETRPRDILVSGKRQLGFLIRGWNRFVDQNLGFLASVPRSASYCPKTPLLQEQHRGEGGNSYHAAQSWFLGSSQALPCSSGRKSRALCCQHADLI